MRRLGLRGRRRAAPRAMTMTTTRRRTKMVTTTTRTKGAAAGCAAERQQRALPTQHTISQLRLHTSRAQKRPSPPRPQVQYEDPYHLPVTHEVVLKGHSRLVSCLDVEHSGSRLVSGGRARARARPISGPALSLSHPHSRPRPRTPSLARSFDYNVRLYDFNGMKRDLRPFRELEQPCGSHQARPPRPSPAPTHRTHVRIPPPPARTSRPNVPAAQIRAVSWSPSGDQFIVISGSSQPKARSLSPSRPPSPRPAHRLATPRASCSPPSSHATPIFRWSKHRTYTIFSSKPRPLAQLFDRDGRTLGEFGKGDMYIRDLKHTKGHIMGCTSGQWSPVDKQTCLTASEDGSLRLWDVSYASKEDMQALKTQAQVAVIKPQQLKPGRQSVTACCFSPDGKTIAGAVSDGSIQFWSATSNFSSAAVGQARGAEWTALPRWLSRRHPPPWNHRLTSAWALPSRRCSRPGSSSTSRTTGATRTSAAPACCALRHSRALRPHDSLLTPPPGYTHRQDRGCVQRGAPDGGGRDVPPVQPRGDAPPHPVHGRVDEALGRAQHQGAAPRGGRPRDGQRPHPGCVQPGRGARGHRRQRLARGGLRRPRLLRDELVQARAPPWGARRLRRRAPVARQAQPDLRRCRRGQGARAAATPPAAPASSALDSIDQPPTNADRRSPRPGFARTAGGGPAYPLRPGFQQPRRPAGGRPRAAPQGPGRPHDQPGAHPTPVILNLSPRPGRGSFPRSSCVRSAAR